MYRIAKAEYNNLYVYLIKENKTKSWSIIHQKNNYILDDILFICGIKLNPIKNGMNITENVDNHSKEIDKRLNNLIDKILSNNLLTLYNHV